MKDDEHEESRGGKGIRQLVSLPLGAVKQPYRRWLERKAERRQVEEAAREIKEEAAAQMRNFHEALWQQWEPESLERINTGREEK